ncbi:hypothetical protein N9M45_03670 [Euryarchaeota archaeon]|nr:hypothetical protein [Euryarchaeota archaeon]
MPEDGGEPRKVYIGTKEEWSLEETKGRVGSRHGRWTDPLTPRATKAKWGKATFDTGRYRCCHDLEQCGVGVAVKQGPIQAWHFQRQWNYGNNSLYEYRCKNESQYRGESRFHSTATRTIARMLTPGKKLDGKTVSEKAAHEKSRRFRLKSNEVVSLTPDVYVKFDDDTWFAIEVVYTHPPERNNHDAYGTNMVVIDLKELRAVDSDQAFAKWIREEGLEKALKRESKKERRFQRYDSRKLGFERQDEKEYLSAWVYELRRCRDDYEIYTLMELDRNIKIENIEDYFAKEKKRLQKLESIEKAIVRNAKRYGERLPRGPEDFSLVKDVDGYYRKELGKTLKEKETEANEFLRLEEAYSEQFGPGFVEKHDTIDELKTAADELLKLKKPLDDLEKKNLSDFNDKVKKLDDELEAIFQNLTDDFEIINSIQNLINSSDFIPDEGPMTFWYKKDTSGHTVRSGNGTKFLQTVDTICHNPWTHICSHFVVDEEEYNQVIQKGKTKIEDICLRHKKTYTSFYNWLDKLRDAVERLRKYDGFDGTVAADFRDLVGAGNSVWRMKFIQNVIDSGVDPARQIRGLTIDDEFWKSRGVSKLFSDIKLQDAWNECMRKADEKRGRERKEKRDKLPERTGKDEPFNPFARDASAQQNNRNTAQRNQIIEHTRSLFPQRQRREFDPFAHDASAQRSKRMSEHSQSQRRNSPPPSPAQRPQQNNQSAHDELAKKRQEALNRLGTQDSSTKANSQPKTQSETTAEPTFTNSVEKAEVSPPKTPREKRMAELLRKSEESRKNAKLQLSDNVQVQPEIQQEAEAKRNKEKTQGDEKKLVDPNSSESVMEGSKRKTTISKMKLKLRKKEPFDEKEEKVFTELSPAERQELLDSR